MNELNQTPCCRSVFKGGENQTTTEQFTNAWITLINKLEQSKGLVPLAG